MNKNTTLIVGVVLLIAVLLVAVGFAAISNIELFVSGTANAEAKDANFKVVFGENRTATTKALAADGETALTDVTVTTGRTDDKHVTMNVTGLSAKGQTASATYTIQNTSDDLSARLSSQVTSGNKEYFEVTSVINDNDTPLVQGGSRTVTVTVRLKKTPIADETDAKELTANIGVTLTAEPVQPTV